jgi:hypothetical protein
MFTLFNLKQKVNRLPNIMVEEAKVTALTSARTMLSFVFLPAIVSKQNPLTVAT